MVSQKSVTTPKGKRMFGHVAVPLKRVHMELTNICEFNCLFCPKDQLSRPRGYMDVGLAKSVMDELKDNDVCQKITFHVMGEPTLHPSFFEILDYAHLKGLKAGITTNGAGLKGPVGQRLADYDVHQIDISLQTPDAASFQLRRAGSLTYEEYIKGILDFFEKYDVRKKNTIFKFRFLNTRFATKEMNTRLHALSINASSRELQRNFRTWTNRIYDLLQVQGNTRDRALKKIDSIVSYRWNVVEVYDGVFFETYLLSDWTDAYAQKGVRDAWAGFCFGMRDHFSVLHNGDVVLCCIDMNGRTAIGNVNNSSLREILSSSAVGDIMQGFRTFQFVHPYCKKCQGSRSVASWMTKPVGQILSRKILKPFFYRQSRLLD